MVGRDVRSPAGGLANAAEPRGAQVASRAQAPRRMRSRKPPHPLEHHPSVRAVIAAAPPLAELASRLGSRADAGSLVGTLAIACGDLADGFAAPPDSRKRIAAHHRAWIAVRELDRAVTAAARRRLAPAEVVRRAQRAIDRADVLIGALLPA